MLTNKKKTNQNQDNIHFKNAAYRVLQERSNNTVSFPDHLKFEEMLLFADALWINCSKLKLKKLESRDHTF